MTNEDGPATSGRALGLRRSMTVLASACLIGAAVLVVVALRSANAAEPVLWVESASVAAGDAPEPTPERAADAAVTDVTVQARPDRDVGGDLEIAIEQPASEVEASTGPDGPAGTSESSSDVPSPDLPSPEAPTEVPTELTPLPPKQAPLAVTSSRATFGHLPVIPVGKEDDGKLEVPGADEIGWYKYGSSPGRPGATVLAAHVSWNGELGPFWELGKLQLGDVVDVTLQDGTVDQYEVVEVTMYPKDALPRERIWTETGPETLVLITCGGEFDDSINRYKHNIVVYATPID